MIFLAKLCYAWLCFAMLCFFMTSLYLLCSALFRFAMPGHARVCFATNGYASIGYMLCRCCSRLYKNSGTHESGHPRHYKNNGTHDSGIIFLEPESCVPLLSRAGMLRICSLLEKNNNFDPNREVLEKMHVWGPFVGGAQPGPKREKL